MNDKVERARDPRAPEANPLPFSASPLDRVFSMSNPTVVGNYGCLQLLKKNRDVAVASYPIDGEVLVFGRAPMCDIRLYFDTVSSLHCKLIFEERKARLLCNLLRCVY